MGLANLMALALMAHAPSSEEKGLDGWLVCLEFDPSGKLSTTSMELSPIPKDDVESRDIFGSFYGSAFEQATVTRRDHQVFLAAKTSDASGQYFHSGELTEPGQIRGRTWSVGRSFLMPWTAYADRQQCPMNL